jgi:preprotein translocase subunit SecG
MTTILLVIHLMVALAMIVLVLLQRSEGGALGIGGGGGDGMMSARGLGNAMTRATALLAGVFFLTSIGLTVLSTVENRSSVLDSQMELDGTTPAGPLAPAPILPDLGDLPIPESK